MLETAEPLRMLPFAALVALRAPAPAPGPAPAPAPATPQAPWVGLGEVVDLDAAGRARVRLQDATGDVVTPAWALPFAYAPRTGDALVVIRRGERAWVLAVARGRGASLVWSEGDLTLAASGALRLASDVGVRVAGEVVTLRGRVVDVAAGALHAVADDAVERVAGLARLVAGAVRRVTAGTEEVVARKVTLLGAELVKLDGGVTVLG